MATTLFSARIVHKVGMSLLNASAPEACDDREKESYTGPVRLGQSGAPTVPAVLRAPALVVRSPRNSQRDYFTLAARR